MRPLIFWARDHHATLRLARRSPTELTGRVVIDGQPVLFHFDLRTSVLTLGEGENKRCLQLGDYGWEI